MEIPERSRLGLFDYSPLLNLLWYMPGTQGPRHSLLFHMPSLALDQSHQTSQALECGIEKTK